MKFCKSCGLEIKSNTHFCKNCGYQLTSIPCEPTEENTTTRSPQKKIAIYILSFVTLFLLSGGIGGYYYVTASSSPQPLIDNFKQALKNKDVDELSSLILFDQNRSLSKAEWQKLVDELYKEPYIIDKVFDSIAQQQKELGKHGEFTDDAFIFKLNKEKEKQWGIIDQYTISLLPISFRVEVDKEAEVFMNKKGINPTGENFRTIENIPPGSVTLKAIKKGEFDTFETEETIIILESPKSPVSLVFTESFVTVNTSQPGTDLYVNGKIYGKFIENELKIGPLNKDQIVTLQGKYTYPSGEVYSEKVLAAGDETVHLKIPPESVEEQEEVEPGVVTVYVDAPFNETAVKVAVMDTVFGYNSSYIHAITNLDTSFLRNAKGAQLKEATDIIADLIRRNVYYVGHLVEMKFDAASFSIEQVDGTYRASVSVEETYMSGWKKASAQTSPALQQKKYYFTYYCEYETSSGLWIVTRNKEHKGLTIRDAVYY